MLTKLEPFFWLAGIILIYKGLVDLFAVVKFLKRRESIAALASVVFITTFTFAALHGVSMGLAVFSGSITMLLINWRLYAVAKQRVFDKKPAARKTLGNTKKTVMTHLVLITGAIIFFIPFYWLVSTSFKEDDDILKFPPVWVPQKQVQMIVGGTDRYLSTMIIDGNKVKVAELKDFEDGSKLVKVLDKQKHAGQELIAMPGTLTQVKRFGLKWENYPKTLEYLPSETHKGLTYLINTLLIAILSTFGTVLSSAMVAYSFARLRWPCREACFVLLLATMMLPGAVTMLPVFLIFRSLGWIDSLKPLWVPSFFGAAFNIFLLRQFLKGIPKDLDEAAIIDGASYFSIFWRVILPQIKPALAAITVMSFMGAWNNFMGPLIYLNTPAKMTISYALQLFQGDHGAQYGMIMAASTLVVLPIIVLFFFTQRYFIEGITLTGMGGR